MPEHQIKITTVADLTGLKQIQEQLNAIREMAKEISKTGVQLGMPGTPVMSPAMADAKQKIAASQARVQETLNRRGGAGSVAGAAFQSPEFWQNYAQGLETYGAAIAPQLAVANQAMRVSSGGLGGTGRVRYVKKPGTITVPGEKNIVPPMGSQERADIWVNEAREAILAGKLKAADDMIARFIKAAGASPEERMNLYREFAAEANMIPIPAAGGAGGGGKGPGRSFLRGISGGRGGGGSLAESWSAEGIAGAAGGLISKFLPLTPLAIGAAAIGLGVSSFDKYLKSGEALSPLTKQITSAGDSLEKFQDQVNAAGAALGYNATQVAQVANIIGVGLGHLGTAGLVGASAQAMGFSRAFGLPATAVAQAMVQAGQLGLTMGTGAQLNNRQFLLGIGASSFASGMQGRTGQLIDEITQLAKTVANTAVVVPNVIGMMSAITALNQTGIRTLQGAGGAALLGQASQGIANPNGPLGTWIQMSAFSQAGFKGSYPEMLLQAGEGAFGLLPNGEWNLEALIEQYKKQLPGANFNAPVGSKAHQQAAIMALELGKLNLGLNPNQTEAILRSALSDPRALAAIQKNLQEAMKGGGVFTADQLKNLPAAQWGYATAIMEAKQTKQLLDVAYQMNKGGVPGISTEFIEQLKREPISQGQKDLAKLLLAAAGAKPLTTTEKIDTMKATVTNLQIDFAGSLANILSGKERPSTYYTSRFPNLTPYAQFSGPPSAPPSGSSPNSGGGNTPWWQQDWNAIKNWWDTFWGGEPAHAETLPSSSASGAGNGKISGQGYYMGQSATPLVAIPNLYGSGIGRSTSVTPISFGGKSGFLSKMLSYAQKASQATGLPVDFILSQWSEESGWGTSVAARENLNFAGIKPFGKYGAGSDTEYAGFSSLGDFEAAYVSVINNPRYAGARQAARSGASVSTIADLLHKEGYAEDPNYGASISSFAAAVDKFIQAVNKLGQNVSRNPSSLTGIATGQSGVFGYG